jgi:hypothetical protein
MIFKWMKEKYGFSTRDMSLIAGTYQILSIGTFGMLWVGCYRYNPSLIARNSPFLKSKLANFKITYPNASNNINQKINKVKQWSENNKYIKQLSFHIGAKPKRLTTSFLEAFVIEKGGFIIFTPCQLGLSVWCVKNLTIFEKKNDNPVVDYIEEIYIDDFSDVNETD